MQTLKLNRTTTLLRPVGKFIYTAFILLILLVAALYLNNAYKAAKAVAFPKDAVTISQGVLEEKYGLHMTLVAVTAAGGFVDVRIKIIDGEKAKALLSDKNNFPALWVKGRGTLNAPEDTKSQAIQFETGSTIFVMYPNSANAIKSGDAVSILFGDVALEPVEAQ
jgi:hypothetical protein